MIARNQIFELYHLSKIDYLSFTQQKLIAKGTDGSKGCVLTMSSASSLQNRQPKTRPEFFALLYSFGQFNLQIFPSKGAAFLKYLMYLTKYASHYHISTLIKLDNSIRHFFVQHPERNWEVQGTEVSTFVKDANLEHAKLSAANAKSKPKHNQTQQKGKIRYDNYAVRSVSSKNKGRSGRSQYDNRSYDNSRSADPREHRCRNWNFRECVNNPRCFCDHVCYECGDPNHKAKNCSYNYKNY